MSRELGSGGRLEDQKNIWERRRGRGINLPALEKHRIQKVSGEMGNQKTLPLQARPSGDIESPMHILKAPSNAAASTASCDAFAHDPVN